MSHRLNQTDARLHLITVADNFEVPQMDDREGYVCFLNGICTDLARAGNHIGAKKLESIRVALLTTYKLGYLDGMKGNDGEGRSS